MKQVKCKKQFGVWYYEKINPNDYNDLDAPIYELYDDKKRFVNTFGCYNDMKYYIETGEIL
jgi:hypothetical protein